MTLLQDWTVISAVGLGVGGSMLASLLFEWLRPHPSRTTPQPGREETAYPPLTPLARQRSETVPAALPGHPIALIGSVLIFTWVCRRRARRRP